MKKETIEQKIMNTFNISKLTFEIIYLARHKIGEFIPTIHTLEYPSYSQALQEFEQLEKNNPDFKIYNKKLLIKLKED